MRTGGHSLEDSLINPAALRYPNCQISYSFIVHEKERKEYPWGAPPKTQGSPLIHRVLQLANGPCVMGIDPCLRAIMAIMATAFLVTALRKSLWDLPLAIFYLIYQKLC